MKKILAFLSLIMLLVGASGCHQHSYSSEWSSDIVQHWHSATCHNEQKAEVAPHVWVESGNIDADGKAIYECSVCGFTHQHIYDDTKWEFNGREHWHPVICGHSEAKLYGEEHSFDDETGICSICGCDQDKADGYEVAFAYYVVDENGNPVADSSGNYSQIGVTYTSVEKNGSTKIDTVNGAILFDGDSISFTVKKSVFCYYTDGADKPLVEVISSNDEGKKIREAIYPDENDIYTVSIKSDTIISVANVQTSPITMSGKGTQEEPFTINSEVDWLYFAMYVNDKSYYSIEYNIAYWKLNADLDFEGESIYVIGDGYSSVNSVFCGNFDGNGHTISNFTLENTLSASVGLGYSNYLGLFGVVTGYVGVDSVIANLTVENVVVNATAGKDDIVSAGCLIGYGVGVNIRNCTVRNGQINVVADDTYMSFAGGMVGFLQSGKTEEGILFYSSVAYSVSENISIKGTGMLYSAGGIVGRVVSYNSQVTSFIINCYSTGTISDAVRAGGIAGELQRYSSLQNSYSTANVSAYSTYKLAVEEKFDGTVYDDRYAYAGGIVGYVENDTVVEGCFFDGNTYVNALAGKNFAKKANIVAGISQENFADYYANKAFVNNQADGVKVDNNYLKNQLEWSEADWVFGEGYPTINQEEVARSFKVTININGENKHYCTIDSQYIPLSYWYIIDGNSTNIETISRYYLDGENRTYGYYFDSQLTKPVPVGYVPMKNMTLYTRYSNLNSVAGEYYLSNNGVSAVLTINTDGTYEYEEGAILLKGEYNFNGQVVTFEDSVFSRMASSATSTQKASYYTFWAKLQADGNLHLFDCDELYAVTSEEETQNPNFTAMARFYPISNPLKIICAKNLSFTGGYYYNDGNAKHVFEFNNDYTGSYKKYNGENIITDTFSFKTQGNSSIIISLDKNGTQFVANVSEGIPVSINDNRGEDFALSKIDQFVGTWEKQATSHKVYTFDGMGGWTYEHFVYLNDDNLVNANKQVVSRDSGIYSLIEGELVLTRNENGNLINVVATISNGVISIVENGQPVEVEFNNVNGYKGVWYTANNKIVRYTLTLEGLNGNGVGLATLDGFGIEPLKLRYTAISNDTLYLYVENIVYAILQYSPKTGLFEGMFYDSATGSTTTPQTLYLYDDFTGYWVSDLQGISSIKFNGFGAYNTTDKTGNSLAVKGVATIGNDAVDYTIDRQTGKAQFTYKGIKYVLSYNEYTNSISVDYNGLHGIIAKADRYIDIVLYNEQGSYKFDGRGDFAQGGNVAVNGVSGKYKIQANGDLLLQFVGQADKIISVQKQDEKIIGYSLNGLTLYVDNAFSGVWAVPSENVSITVGNFTYMPENGQTLKVLGKFNKTDVTMYFNGSDTITFENNGKKYSLINTLGGKVPALILTETVNIGEEVVTEKIVVSQDDYFGVWTRVDNARYTLTFDGCGGSDYVSSGKVSNRENNVSYRNTYKVVNGVVTIYDGNTGKAIATFDECEKNDGGEYINTTKAYVNNGRYYKLNQI